MKNQDEEIANLKKAISELKKKYDSLKRQTERKISEGKQAEQEHLVHLRFLESMNQVNRTIQGANDLEQMMSDVLDLVLSTLKCDRAVLVYPCDPESPTWSSPMERTRTEFPGLLELGKEMPTDHDVAEIFRILLKSNDPVRFGPDSEYSLIPDADEKFGIKSFLGIALYPKVGEPWQFGIYQCSYARKWTEEEVRLFKEIGRRLCDGLTGILSHRNLQESEQRYKMVFENSPVSIWEEDFSEIKKLFDDLRSKGTTDIEKYFELHADAIQKCADLVKINDVNKSALELYEAPTKKDLIKNLVHTFTEQSFETIGKGLVCIWNGGTEMVSDTVIKTIKGKRRDVTMFFSICPGYEDTLSKILVTLIDITESNQALESIRKQEQKFRSLAENSPDNIMRYNKECQLIYANSQPQTNFGYEESIFMGKTPLESNPNGLYDGGREEVVNVEAALKSVLSGNGTMDVEMHIPSGSGGLRIHTVRLAAEHDIEGNIIGALAFGRDVTEQKEAEQNLKLLNFALNNVFNEVYLINEKGCFDYVNDESCRVLGYSRQELLAMNVTDINPDTSYEDWSENWKKIHNKAAFIFESVHIKKDGTVYPVEISTTSFEYNGQGYSLTLARDITECKQAEERYRLIAENTADTISVRDLELNTIYISPSVQKLRGYTVEESISQTVDKFLTPASIQKVKKVLSEQLDMEASNTADPSRSVLLELEQIHKNGSIVNVEISVSFIRDDKLNPINLLVISRDITQRKQVEERIKILSHAIEQNPVMIVITDTEGIIEYANPKFEEVTGYSLSEAIGTNPRIIKSGKMPKELYKDMWDTIKANNVWQGELINKKKNDKLFWANLSISPITDADGNVTHFVGIQEDISERKKIEEELISAKEKAEESDRLKSAFLANMSHEIRTPMNGILGFSELLKNPELTGIQKDKYIKIIEKSGARMLSIINDIVDISKIESGTVEIVNKRTSINEQIEQVFHLLKPEADEKGIHLSFTNGLAANESIVKTDNHKLYSILTNLVKNAIKFTNKGAVEFGYNKNENHLEFFVKDTGIGIPKNRQQAIFERFIQADIEDKMARQGAGLGLSISSAYADMLGGKIWVESEEGIGTTFYFKLPYNNISKEINERKNDFVTDEESNMINPEISGLKILIAEDDEISKMLISLEINEFCEEIINVTTGAEAIEACRKNPDLDLILMDIQMQGLNGYEATRQIRQFNKDIVIIAQTAFGLTGDREKAIEAGCNDYISKPFKKAELISLVTKHFKKD